MRRYRKKPLIILSVAALGSLGILSSFIISAVKQKTKSAEVDTAFASAITPGTVYISSLEDDTYLPPAPENDNLNWGHQGTNDANTEFGTDNTPFVPATKLDTEPTSITVFINKEYVLDSTYVPKDLMEPAVRFSSSSYGEQKLMRPEAGFALEYLFNAAQADGCTLYAVSGYRSYDRQHKIFINNIMKNGKEHALMYSAVPGASEHQTGLSIDLSAPSMSGQLVARFADTHEGQWLAKNAYRFGFIIRYPEGKEDITEYAFEPWHIRYVGRGLANYLYKNNLTLEEYYKYTPSEDFDFEATYADLINYRPPTPIPRKIQKVKELTPTMIPSISPEAPDEDITTGTKEEKRPKLDKPDPPETIVVPTLPSSVTPDPGQSSSSMDQNTPSTAPPNVEEKSSEGQSTTGQITNDSSMNALSIDVQTVNETYDPANN